MRPRPLVVRLSFGALVAAGTLVAVAHRPADIRLPTLRVPHTARSPTIDGEPTEAEWSQAARTGPLALSNGVGFPRRAAEAGLLWDEHALYVAFWVEDRELTSPYGARDDDLFLADVCEIFLDPGGDGLDYVELEVSPRGVVFDARFPRVRHDLPRSRRWTAEGLRWAAQANGTVDDPSDTDVGYSIEVAIPWAALGDAARSQTLRANLFRIDVDARGDGAYAAWSPPIVGDFHTLDRFGTLQLVE